MRVLIACEESQEVCKAFRARRHEAYSCDIEPCSGGRPEWHIRGDVTPLLKVKWDMIIAFPPCTYLTVAGNRWFNVDKYGEKAIQRNKDRNKAIDFFKLFVNVNCNKVIIENPVGIMSTVYRKPDQIIHPYYFGDPYLKRTCLWIKGVNPLQYKNVLNKPEPMYVCKSGKRLNWCEGLTGSNNGAKNRSKTFPGIAQAMAEQWG